MLLYFQFFLSHITFAEFNLYRVYVILRTLGFCHCYIVNSESQKSIA